MSREKDDDMDFSVSVDIPDLDEDEIQPGQGKQKNEKGKGEIKLKEIPGLAELEAGESAEKKSSSRSYTLILLILFVFSAAVYILNEMREQSLRKYLEELSNQAEISQQEAGPLVLNDNQGDTATQPAPTPRKTPPKHTLTQDLSGTAILTTREKGPLFSPEIDPEIAALGQALRIRVEKLYGVKTRKTRGGTITETTSGNFQGFKITGTKVTKADQVIKEEIVVNTPSRGSFTILDNILEATRNLTYEKLYQDLDNSGISVTKNPLPEENKIKVSLQVANIPQPTKAGAKTDNDMLLISGNAVGPVKIDMSIDQMKTVLPPNFKYARKSFQHEGEFYKLVKVFDENQKEMFFVTEKNNKVWGIQIINKNYKTAKGIGIGSTLGTLRVYYAKPKIWSAGGAPLVSVSGINGVFVLDAKGVNVEKEIFPGNTKITSILIGGSPFLK